MLLASTALVGVAMAWEVQAQTYSGSALPTMPATGNSGGSGGGGYGGYQGGNGGSGGNGADVNGSGALGSLRSTVTGGAGGNGGGGSIKGGDGGNGGLGLNFSNAAGVSLTTAASVIGGAGGNGGNGGIASGAGGAGGAGLSLLGSSANALIVNGTNTGGAAGFGPQGGFPGAGGAGGAGIVVTGTGGASVTVNAAVAGGVAGFGQYTPGQGGDGLIGQALSVNLGSSGSITGGMSSDGTTQANAITFTGGANTLTLAGGSLSGNVGLAGTAQLTFDLSQANNSATLSNAITGSGSVNLAKGSLTLSGASTYSGTTSVTGYLAGGATNAFSANSAHTVDGTLDLGGYNQAIGSLAGGGTVTNNGGAGAVLTTGGDNTSTTFSGIIQDGTRTTGLAKTGSGTFSLSGSNTYSGGTTLMSGTLQIGNSIALGTGGVIFDGGTLQSDSQNNYTLANNAMLNAAGGTIDSNGKQLTLTGNITNGSGATPGGLTITDASMTGGGTVILTGNNTFTGATTVNAGTLTGGAANTFSAASATTINTGGTLDLGGFAQSITTVTLNGGTLQNGILSGSITTMGGKISELAGTASLTVNSGTTIVTTVPGGLNSYTGATIINGGTLQAGPPNGFSHASATTINTGGTLDLGGFAQAIDAVTLNGGTLKNGSLSGAIASTGGTINGLGGAATLATSTGTTTVTGINGYTGATTINGGVLIVTGSVTASNITVNSGGTLAGSGKIGDPTINAGGTLAAGDPTAATGSVLSIYGPLTFAAGANYNVRISPTVSDKTAVTGTALLGGATVNVAAGSGSYAPNTTYTILTATQGFNGSTFNPVVTTNLAFLNSTLVYDANDVYLKVTPVSSTVDYRIAANNQNQANFATALNGYASGAGSSALVTALNNATMAGARSAFNQLSPHGDAGIYSSAISTGNTFASQLLSCKVAGAAGDAEAVIRESQCVWARANVRELTRDSTTDVVGYRATTAFYSGGAQLDLGGPWRVGGGFGFETTDLSTASSATTNGDRIHGGAVLKYNEGPWVLAASITGGGGWFDNTRAVALSGYSANATSKSTSEFAVGRLTAAYVFGLGGAFYAKPEIDLALSGLKRDAYTEKATGGIGLAVGASRATVFSAAPSLEIGHEWRREDLGVLRSFVRAGVLVMDTGAYATTASFLDGPVGSNAFSISTKVDQVLAEVGAGVDVIAKDGVALKLQYDGQLGDTTTQHGGTAKLSIPF